MLKDLFFNIYAYMGGSLTFLFLLFTFITLPILVWVIIDGIIKYKKECRKFTIIKTFLTVVLGFVLLLPAIADFVNLYGTLFQNKDAQCLAVKLAPIPWQKGVYYIKIGNSTYTEDSIEYYTKAYELIGSYKYKCWGGIPLLKYYRYGLLDIAAEIAESTNNQKMLAKIKKEAQRD